MSDQVYGNQSPSSDANDFNTIAFAFQMLMAKVQTGTLVKVISCTSAGELAPVGRVTVQPLVNQMSGNRQATAHGQIFNCVYSRLTGGDNAVIMDPEAGDVGFMGFCSRDISAVVAGDGAAANPGSFRWFDWADGVLIGWLPLGKTPTQYVRFLQGGAGIEIVSPTKITLTAPTVEIDASSQLTVNSPDSEFSGNITAQGTITGVTQVVAGSGGSAVHLTTHEHPTAAPGAPSPPTPGT